MMASLASALFAEGTIIILCAVDRSVSVYCSVGISWLLIYRTESYKQLKAQIDRLQQKGMHKKRDTRLGLDIDDL